MLTASYWPPITSTARTPIAAPLRAFTAEAWRSGFKTGAHRSRSPYGTSRRCRPGLDHQSLALSMIRPAPPTSAVMNFSSAAQVSLKSTVRISAGQNRSWRGTLTSASAMRSVMERFTPMKLCIRQSRDRDGKFVSTERLRFVTQLYEYNRSRAGSEREFLSHSDQPCQLLAPSFDRR